jgi:hypothetical protein
VINHSLENGRWDNFCTRPVSKLEVQFTFVWSNSISLSLFVCQVGLSPRYSRQTFSSQSLQHLLKRNLVTLKIEAAPYSETSENTYDPTLCNNPEDYHLTRILREGLNIYIMSYYLLLHRCRPLGCSVRRNAYVKQDHLLPNPYLFNIHDSPSTSFVNKRRETTTNEG